MVGKKQKVRFCVFFGIDSNERKSGICGSYDFSFTWFCSNVFQQYFFFPCVWSLLTTVFSCDFLSLPLPLLLRLCGAVAREG